MQQQLFQAHVLHLPAHAKQLPHGHVGDSDVGGNGHGFCVDMHHPNVDWGYGFSGDLVKKKDSRNGVPSSIKELLHCRRLWKLHAVALKSSQAIRHGVLGSSTVLRELLEDSVSGLRSECANTAMSRSMEWWNRELEFAQLVGVFRTVAQCSRSTATESSLQVDAGSAERANWLRN